MIVLDTHAAIWWTLEPKRLSAKARRVIDGADRLGIPAIVFWEVALLARKGRLAMGITVSEWVKQVLAIPRIDALSLTPAIAIGADALEMHDDPADRFVVATALHHDAPLVTKDRLIRKAQVVRTVW